MGLLKPSLPSPEIAFALLARGVQGATALMAAVCVAWSFSLEQQGLFFVFLSFGALVQLSDFGLTYAALQTGGWIASIDASAQLASFQRKARQLGVWVMLAAALWVGGLGLAVFAGRTQSLWTAPWMAFIMATTVAQYMQVELALVEGTRSAALAWRVRLIQESLGGGAFVLALWGGAGLWSLCVYWGARAVLAAIWLGRAGNWQAAPLPRQRTSFSWRQHVWPFQWRMGLSGLSGFLIFQAFNPILLVTQGSAVAGTFGMSLAIMNMLLLVTTAWPLSQAARYGSLLTQGLYDELQHKFWRMWIGSSALAGLTIILLLLALYWMNAYRWPLIDRLADLSTTAALLGAAWVHHATACFAVLLRAERREPLLTLTVLGGLLGVTAVWFVAHHGVVRDVALTHLVCTLTGFFIVLWKYRRFNARHRAANFAASADSKKSDAP